MSNKKPKMSRKERERRILAEMDAALMQNNLPDGQNVESAPAQTEKTASRVVENRAKQGQKQGQNQGQRLHCPRCKAWMENGKCPTCGHYIYVPMDKDKRNKIRWIVGGVCMVGFVILFVLLQMKK